MTKTITKNNCFLIDIDGVLLLEEHAIDGAAEAIDFLNKNNVNYLLVTNFSRLPRKQLLERLQKAGLKIPENKVFTPVTGAIDYIKSQKKQKLKVFLIGPQGLAEEFLEARIETTTEEAVDFVVLGLDLQTNYEILNKAFRLLKNGAGFVALHSYKHHPTKNGLALSLGCFVKGLEYCSDKKAIIIGKPNKRFFDLAIKQINASKKNTFMIGDDLDGDIIGAKKAGLKTIMVKTGGYNSAQLEKSKQKPDYLIESIKELPKMFKQ